MASPTEIIEDLVRGKAYFANLDADKIQEKMDGCDDCGCGDSLWKCLFSTLKSLDMRIDQGVFDDVTDILYHRMMLIIGDFTGSGPVPVLYGVDYGYSDIDYTDNYEAMIFQFSKQYPVTATTITLDYTLASQGKRLFFRVRTGFSKFFKWQIDADEYELIPGFQWKDPETSFIYDYYLSRQPIYLNPGKTSITYLGNPVSFQQLVISYVPNDSGNGAPDGKVQVLNSSDEGKVVIELDVDDVFTINRVVPDIFELKNATTIPVYLYINEEFITTLSVGQSYTLPDDTSIIKKAIKFVYSEET